MSGTLWFLAVATALLAVGLWCLLPRPSATGRSAGALLVAVALGLLASQMPRLGSWATDGVFYILAAVTVGSAVATVSFRNPVYSAIWFALSLLGTAGLFLFDGAQFLGVATVVVYAGAILVTFLFVLMLAQTHGNAYYDQISWTPFLAALTGAVMVGVLTLAIVGTFGRSDIQSQAPAAAELERDVLSTEHMAHLGAVLFSQYLVAVEVAGTLLLVALVGAVAIVARIRQPDQRARAGG